MCLFTNDKSTDCQHSQCLIAQTIFSLNNKILQKNASMNQVHFEDVEKRMLQIEGQKFDKIDEYKDSLNDLNPQQNRMRNGNKVNYIEGYNQCQRRAVNKKTHKERINQLEDEVKYLRRVVLQMHEMLVKKGVISSLI